jgi:hypothetical protein
MSELDGQGLSVVIRMAEGELQREDWHERAGVMRSLLEHAMPFLRLTLDGWFGRQLELLRAAETREEAAQIRSRLCWMGERGEITRQQWRAVGDAYAERWPVGVLGTWSSRTDHGE